MIKCPAMVRPSRCGEADDLCVKLPHFLPAWPPMPIFFSRAIARSGIDGEG
jgi:hypothetical protein